jgi:hypothetical protein
MDWQTRLVAVYVMVCDIFKQHGFSCCLERMSNNKSVTMTDEEVLTIYLFGILSHRRTLKQIHSYAYDHLREWFPKLFCYETLVRRVDEMGEMLPVFLEILLDVQCDPTIRSRFKLIDSFPIVLAGPKRSNQAKVAPEIANKGFCSTKNLFYYGVKLHILGSDQEGSMPIPEFVGLTPGSEHDLNALKTILPQMVNMEIFGDKAYGDQETRAGLLTQHTQLATPVKLKRGQKSLDSADRFYSAAVSSIRQPIESLFSWIQEKTGIQCASKVRSYKGLMVHVFGRLAAAMMMLHMV